MSITERVSRKFTIPAIREIYMPEPRPSPEKDAEFGIVELEDGSAGLYYAWLGDSQRGMNERFDIDDIVGQNPLTLANSYLGRLEDERSLGLAAINAVTHSVLRQCGFSVNTAGNSLGGMKFKHDDYVGMVGYFPSLINKIRDMNINLTVIEKKSRFLMRDTDVEVTLDIKKLHLCNKIIVTAATMLNDTIDEVLGYTRQAEMVIVLGPTAGFFPDPLFERGVTAVGGSRIVDADVAINRLRNEKGLGDCARKYIIYKDAYPGIDRLIQR